METLGDDLVLLSIRSDGVISTAAKLRFGLSGAELVRLAALRRVDIERGRIIILDETPTGDVLLDEALMSMAGGRRRRHGSHIGTGT
jgi:Golgi phosphoprotein 3 (GPP34)